MIKKISLYVFFGLMAINLQAETAKSILDNTIAAINTKYKGAKFTLRQTEKLIGKGTLRVGEVYTKVNVNPLSIYAKVLIDPNKGTELLYVKGVNNGKLRVNPGKLLPTLSLAPTSSLVTKDQHHTLLNSGFGFVGKIMTDAKKRAEAKGKFEDVFKYEGDVTYQNKNCYKIVATDPTFAYTTVTAQPNENMYSLGSRLLISEYHIMELNGIKSFEENLSGKTVKVPTSYAKKTVLYIDKETNLPLFLEMSDDKGVFEKYEFLNLQLNPSFKADEFTEKFSEYGF